MRQTSPSGNGTPQSWWPPTVPPKSTAAAIAYLADLHAIFGDWLTALASYNCGEHRVLSLIRRQEDGHLDRFWDLYGALPSETARYVPRVLATVAIVPLHLPSPNTISDDAATVTPTPTPVQLA